MNKYCMLRRVKIEQPLDPTLQHGEKYIGMKEKYIFDDRYGIMHEKCFNDIYLLEEDYTAEEIDQALQDRFFSGKKIDY